MDKSKYLPRLIDMAQYENVKIAAVVEDKEVVLYKSIGNTSGLYSYVDTWMKEKWQRSGQRFSKRIAEHLAAGDRIVIYRYQNINRDRGGWKKSTSI